MLTVRPDGSVRGLVAEEAGLAVVVSSLGSMVAHRNQVARLPLWQSMAWGMLYGAIFSLLVTLASGKTLGFEATAAL